MGGTNLNKVILFTLFKFLIEFGYTGCFFGANSLLIHHVGASSLFYVYLGASTLALVISILFSRVIDRFSRRKIFYGTYLMLGGLLLLAWRLIQIFPQSSKIYFGVRVFVYVAFVISGLTWGMMTGNFFTHSEAKRYFSIFTISNILGRILGGLFISFTSAILHSENFILFWGILLLAAPLLLIQIQFPLPQTPGVGTSILWGEIQRPGTGYRSRSFFSSHIILLLLSFWMAYSFFCYGTDYVYNSFAAAKISSEDGLTSFFGMVAAIANIGALFYYLFLGPRLLARHGIFFGLMGISLMVFLPWVIFSAHPTLMTIAFAQGVIFFFDEHVANTRLSSVLTLFPEKVRGRIQIFTAGIGRPMGCILLFLTAGLISLYLGMQPLIVMMLASSALFLAFPFLFRKPYLKHLSNCLYSQDKSLVLNAIQALGEPNNAQAVAPLVSLFQKSPNGYIKKTILFSLCHIQNQEVFGELSKIVPSSEESYQSLVIHSLASTRNPPTLPLLLEFFNRPEQFSWRLRKKILSILAKRLGKKMKPIFLEGLSASDPKIRAACIEFYGQQKDRSIIPLLSPFLSQENPELKAASASALILLCQDRDKLRQEASKALQELLNSGDPSRQRAGIHALGIIKLPSQKPFLSELLNSPDKLLRKETTLTAAQLLNSSFCLPFIDLLLDQDSSIALETAEAIEDLPRACKKRLFQEMAALNEGQKRKIQERLHQIYFELPREMENLN